MPRKLKNYRKIYGHNKIRDGKIILLYRNKALTEEQLAQKFDLTQVRIIQILMKNSVLKDKEYLRQMQIRRTENQIRRKYQQEGGSQKDVADLEELLHKFLDEKVPILDQSQHIHNVYALNIEIDGKKAELPFTREPVKNLSVPE